MKTLFDLIHDMSAISRYSQSHLMKNESVLEHTGFVSICCLHICTKLNQKGEGVNTGIVMVRAAVHDMDEIITGDLPRPTKYDNKMLTELIHNLEKRNMKAISSEVFGDNQIYSEWLDAKENSKEGFILKIADAFAVAYKSWFELKHYGNRSLIPHAAAVKLTLGVTMDKADTYFENWQIVSGMIKSVIDMCEEIENES